MLKLYRTERGAVAEQDGTFSLLPDLSWNRLFTEPDPLRQVTAQLSEAAPTERPSDDELLPPLQGQEVWAAGVTYLRSKAARIEESHAAGGGSFYDRVYDAERPELFFKATPHRVAGPGEAVRIRKDSTWSVPEPELTLAVSAAGRIIGYTIGNDLSARDIEGENPLYLPQAKVYDRSCALGPALLLTETPLPPETEIRLTIRRDGAVAFEGSTTLAQMKRSPEELVAFLFREDRFPLGCLLLTGTGIIPPDAFSLQTGDRVVIVIPPIGTLENPVA